MVRLSPMRRAASSMALAMGIVLATVIGLSGSVTLDNAAAAQGTGSSVRPPASAQGGDMPVVIQPQPSDSDSWRRIRQGITGYVSIPDQKAGVMVQSEGEAWRNINNGPLKTYGGWLLAAMIGIVVLYFAYRRRIPIEHGASGETIERFDGLERFTHWLVAVTFIVLALTGLNVTYGKFVVMPLIGKEAFHVVSQLGKLIHNYLAFGFMVGIVMAFVLWTKENLPNKYDFIWLAKGGGLLVKGVHVPARKFNAGQKLLFWIVILGGVALSATGLLLLFPFAVTDISGMQLAQILHAIVALVMMAIVIGHIYLGTLGMVGAFDAMGSGHVDLNWAREHHNMWVEEMQRSGAAKP